ncbi:MAG: hypothetical protein US49_C0001G0080 [candidate division TM6 bacterium GW2011_GWF2_37_49]|nr:MAG: hypothetical protein US49_C0001G0080 [candidate division TM6 bacterium GW2011_GWF2_37_49]
MCKKFLSALSVILIFTFCSVNPGSSAASRFKKKVAKIKESVKKKIKDKFDIKKQIKEGFNIKGKLKESSDSARKGFSGKAKESIEQTKKSLGISSEGLDESKHKAVKHSADDLGVNAKDSVDKQMAEFADKQQAIEEKKAAEKEAAAEETAKKTAADEERKKAQAKTPMPDKDTKKDFIDQKDIKDGYYKSPSGKWVKVEEGQKFVEVDGKYLRIGEPPKKEPPTIIEKMKQAIASLTKQKQKSLADVMKQDIEKQKKEAIKSEIDELVQRQTKQGPEEDIQSKSGLEDQFIALGKKVALIFPDSSRAIMKASLKLKDTALQRNVEEINKDARAFKSKLYSGFLLTDQHASQSKAWDSEVKKQKQEAIKKFNDDLRTETKALLDAGKPPLSAKDIADREKALKKHLSSDDFRKEVEDSVFGKQKQVELADFDEKIKEENAALDKAGKPQLSDEEVKKQRISFEASLDSEDFKYKALALAKMQRLQKDNPKEYQKKLLEIAKKSKLNPSTLGEIFKPRDASKKLTALNKILTNPETEYEKSQKKALEAAYLNDVKTEMSQTFYEKMTDLSTKARAFSQSPSAMLLAAVVPAILALILGAIQKKVTELTLNWTGLDQGTLSQRALMGDDLNVQLAKMKEENQRLDFVAKQRADDIAKMSIKNAAIKVQADTLDAVSKVSNFYLTFDDYFKNILNKFGYYDRTLNASSKLKYSGGIIDSGIVLLFEYAGAGSIANSFTPVCTKIFPSTIEGEPIQFNAILESVNDSFSYELMAMLFGGYPEPIFLIKAISLFNTATKQFTDPDKRDEFLEDEFFKLFFKLMWTVDERATSRSNALEPNKYLWEPVYFKDVSKCIFNAPDVLRNIVKELVLKSVKGDGGIVADVSFEQFILDKFEDFNLLRMVPFEGDVDFEPDSEQFNPKEIEVGVLIVLMRALNDVLKLEKELIKCTDPVKMRYMNGTEDVMVGKTEYLQITSAAWDKLNQAQEKFVKATVDLGFDSGDPECKTLYQQAEAEHLNAAYAYDISALNFRKKVSAYVFDRTQGLEPETVLDFVGREIKRFYGLASNKDAFDAAFVKVFAPFAPNFPFTAQDILKYAKDSSPIKHPKPKIIETEIDATYDLQAATTAA